ncbi:MAG: DNA polymerase III subunit delta [Bacteroidales bacterium]|nr:DNA polymerase III subunit delta [Bacteroidales bacterium]
MRFEQIINDIENKIFFPIYFFYGEESFFIDQLTDFIEANALDKSVKEFNQSIVYGRDVSVRDLIDLSRRFPMLGNYQLVIVKEAQDIKGIEDMETYLDSYLDTTILVINYKYRKLDKRKAFYKKLNSTKNVVLFESQRLYDNQIPAWIEKTTQQLGYTINPVASRLLSDHLGNDLGKIYNEIEKLIINVEPGQSITEDDIERNIGISKDFNVFEFQNALGTKNALKAQRIVQYFEANPKEHPLQMITVMLHNYFMKVFLYSQLKNKDPKLIAAEIGVHPFFLKDYKTASVVYPSQKIKRIISEIRTLDLKSKGVGSTEGNDYGELKELVFKIIHA